MRQVCSAASASLGSVWPQHAKSISCKDAPALPLWRRSLARSQRVAL
jgi:hypothetical protein